MKINLQETLDSVEMTYQELISIANDITADLFAPLDRIVQELGKINELSNDVIRNYMIQLAINSYSLGEIKEKSNLKAECAAALRKEAMAKRYLAAEGTTAAKDNTALLNSTSEIISEALFELVASLFKTKSDEVHRLIDALKSVLMSRNMEAKLSTNVID